MIALLAVALVAAPLASPAAPPPQAQPAPAPAQPAPAGRQPAPAQAQPAPAPVQQVPAVVELATPAEAQKLCDALAPEDRVQPSGSPLERADALARQDVAREEASARRYRVVVPGERLRFAGYDLEEAVLSLRPHAPLAAADGALMLHTVEDAGLPVEADRATVERILTAQNARELALAITFVTPEDDPAPCFHLAGTPSFTVAAEPVAWEYRAGGAVLARGGEGADRPRVSAKEGAIPRVRLGTVEEGTPVRAAVENRLGELEGCYRTALDRDPWLDGAIVADLAPQASGARIAADTLQDDGLVGCVRNVLGRVDPGRGRAFLPIHFELAPPAAQ